MGPKERSVLRGKQKRGREILQESHKQQEVSYCKQSSWDPANSPGKQSIRRILLIDVFPTFQAQDNGKPKISKTDGDIQ